MTKRYDRELKHMITQLICVEKKPTAQTAKQFEIPLKTVEKWITAFNKNSNVFTEEVLNNDKLIKNLKKEIVKLKNNNEILKKSFFLLTNKKS
ncbi:hypothetical protein [Oceanivirga salmonicida]|uniref:hypothetical protein n=1 Tax=Oceanivirga salmonicida TaxID=1769291 RepID=UPI0008371C5B|nr:hypothetical protein [Oceanivirga salmonicida]